MEFTQSVRKLISSVAMILIATGSLLAQTDLIMISGTIKDDGSGRKLPGSVVVVYQDGQKIDTQEVDRNAGYSFELVLGHEYTFSYEREGFTSKKIVIDVTHATEGESQDGYILDLDMSIFKDVEGFDISILEDPMGIGSYNPSSGKFEWDMDYTDRMKQRLENEFNRLAAIEENREKNKRAFDVAMKAGENFMKKKKWQEALASFNEALDLIPDEAEAIEKRDECRAKLDEIAAKDAEKQAEEDAKRAEEEAEAAKKEAERIAREEEAARRRAEAEARRNGNRNNTASDDNSSGDTSDDTASDDTASDNDDESFQPKEREEAEDNSDSRRADEQADRDARSQAEADAAAEDEARRQKEKEDESRRAELLSQNANNTSDDADNFFREALKSENMARAAEIEEKKQEGEEHLRQRENEAEERREEVRSDLEQKVEYNEQNADEAEARARDRANDVVDAHADNENFKRNKESQSKETRDINAEQIQTTKDGMENLDKSVDQEVPEMYKGKAEEHQDIIEYNQSVVDADKVRQKGHLDQRRIDANSSGYDAYSGANGAYSGEYERNAGTPTLSLADEELPQGFHEYSYEIPNGTVIELTYREGDKIVRYKKVLMKTGTFYFRDNKSITASIFHRETTVIHD